VNRRSNEPMDRLEQELKRALERVEPPMGFAERVMARAAEADRETAGRRGNWWAYFVQARGLRWALTGALCLAIAAGGVGYHLAEQRRLAGEQARDQLMLALRVTASKLQLAQAEVRQMNSPN
jgi:hypothetical protein